MGDKGIVALDRRAVDPAQRGHRRHDPGLADARRPARTATEEVEIAQQVLQSMGLRSFLPQVSACPGCGRTTSTFFQEMARDIQAYLRDQMPAWRETHPGVEELRVAVMGCVVNGPGESKHADIGISLPGTFEDPVAPVFIDGKLDRTLRGDAIVPEFLAILDAYIERRFPAVAPSLTRSCRARIPSPPAARAVRSGRSEAPSVYTSRLNSNGRLLDVGDPHVSFVSGPA